MHETPSWQNDVSRDYEAHSVTFDKTISGVGVGNLTNTAVETISSSASSEGHGRAIAVTVGVVFATLPVGILVIAIFKWWVDRRRARAHLREPDVWRCGSVEAIHGIGSASHGEASSPVSPNLKRASLNSRRVSPCPPTLTFPLGWPDRDQSQSETEKYRHYESASPARLLTGTQFEGIIDSIVEDTALHEGVEEGRLSVSTVDATMGSIGPSATPSFIDSRSWGDVTRISEKFTLRAARQGPGGRRPLPDFPYTPDVLEERCRCASSRWSWSHHTTYHEDKIGLRDSEPLPAYSSRRIRSRSVSTTRSLSRRSSMHDPGERRRGAGNDPSNLPEYPLELGRKVARAYPREPFVPPPPGYDS